MNKPQARKKIVAAVDMLLARIDDYDDVNQIECMLHISPVVVGQNSIVKYCGFRPLWLEYEPNKKS